MSTDTAHYVPLRGNTPREDGQSTPMFQKCESHTRIQTMGTNIEMGTPTKDGQPIEPELTSLQQWRFRLICLYVTDALNTRAPNRRLQSVLPKPGICGIKIIDAYKWSHNSSWSTFVYLLIWIHLSLIFWEPYANIEINDYPWHLYAIELFILTIYSVDVYLFYISHDRQNYRGKLWPKIRNLCIILSFMDILISIITQLATDRNSDTEFLFRFAAVLRPVFLVSRSQFLRSTFHSIIKVIPRVLDVLILVCLYVLMFAVVGYVLFAEEQLGIGVHIEPGKSNQTCLNSTFPELSTDCSSIQNAGNLNFNTLIDSILALCVLLSTSNFPDVMMPTYHVSRGSGFYFAIFVAFGLYYLMPIIFAVIYHHYHAHNGIFVKKMTSNRAKALDFAFKQMIIVSKEGRFQLDNKVLNAIDYNQERIYYPLWRRFMKSRRPNIDEPKCRILYNALCEARARTEAVKLLEDEGEGISRRQWQNLYKFINVEIFRDPSYAVEDILKKGRDKVMFQVLLGDENLFSNSSRCCCGLMKKPFRDLTVNIGDRNQLHECCNHIIYFFYFGWLKFRAYLYRLYNHAIFSRLIDLLVWVGTSILIYQISLAHYDATLDTISDVLIYVFVVEVTLRFIAFGRYFLRDPFNVIDFLVVYISLITDMMAANGEWIGFNGIGQDLGGQGHEQRTNGIVAFRILRFFRALATIPRFKLIISTSVTVLRSLMVLFSMEYCVFYMFAVVGVYCYGYTVTEDSALEMLREANASLDADSINFWTFVRDNYYYDINMNYVSNTLMLMVELTVVNQWHAITRMYVELTSSWSYLYFYFFYFVSVIIVMNVLTAFIFDAFVVQFDFAKIEHDEIQKRRESKKKLEEIRNLRKQRKRRKMIKFKRKQKKKQKKLLKYQQKLFNDKFTNNSIQKPVSNQHQNQPSIVSSIDGYNADLHSNFTEYNLSDSDESNFTDAALKTTEDILDEYIEELNVSRKEEWHKWIAIAMLYEFDHDDVLKGAWLYRRKPTTADFYETVYGQTQQPFIQYLEQWGEQLPEEEEEQQEEEEEESELGEDESSQHTHRKTLSHSNNNGKLLERYDSKMSNQSRASKKSYSKTNSKLLQQQRFSSQSTIRGGGSWTGQKMVITRQAIKARSITLTKEQTIALALHDHEGNIKNIEIKGPKQSSIFSALSTAPQIGFAPQISSRHATKIAKLLDY